MDWYSNNEALRESVLVNTNQVNEAIKIVYEFLPRIDLFLQSKGLSHLTDDFTQEAFTILVAECERQNIEDVKAYFFTIISNLVAKHYKKRQKDESLSTQLFRDAEINTIPRAWVLQNLEEQNHLLQYVFNLMDIHLDEHSRRILQMKYLEGLTYKEISQVTGKTESSLRKTASRAIKKLRSLCL